MPLKERLAGKITVTGGGAHLKEAGEFSYNLGHPKRETILGTGGPEASVVKETPQVPYIEGEIFIFASDSVQAIVTAKDIAVTLELANGKVISGSDGYFAGEGAVNTAENRLPVRWEFPTPLEEQ